MSAQVTIDIKRERATGHWRVEVIQGGRVVARGVYDTLKFAETSARRIYLALSSSNQRRPKC